ncbi:MAG: hypothetical protein ACYC3I_06130 [Gemmataceae bacterium]
MSVVKPPSMQPSDDFDGLLRAFFRRQLPHPWPAPRALSASVVASRSRSATGRSLMRSRGALAASGALLLFGSWLLPSRITPDVKPEHGPNGSLISDNPRGMPKRHKNPKQVENKNKPGLAAEEDEQFPELDESDIPLLK